MESTRYNEYLLLTSMSILIFLLTLFIYYPFIPYVLLYIIHVNYLLILNHYMVKYSIFLTTGSLNIFINIEQLNRLKYGLRRVFKTIMYLHLYVTLLIFTTMSTLSRSLDIFVNTIVLIICTNTFYSSLFYLLNTLFKNSYITVIILILLNAIGLILHNTYLTPFIMFPEVEIAPVITTTSLSILLVFLTTIRWSREWLSRL